MNSYSSLKVNRPKVVDETIDGEVVMINLESGSYYSTDKVGADIWAAVCRSATPAEIADEVAARYAGERGEIEKSVMEFLGRLRDEDLIDVNGRHEKPESTRRATAEEARELLLDFEKPDLQRYDDMQDLLLADPIHDFNEAGWPQDKKA